MSKTVSWVVVIAIVVIGGFVLFGGKSSTPEEAEEPGASTEQQVPAVIGEDVEEMVVAEGASGVVAYTDAGFSPNAVNVEVGQIVTFKNESSSQMWPASAIHPTHKAYPGSNIQKCGTEEATDIFDSCRGIDPGGEWSFTFSEAGQWGYHNHLRPSHAGQVIVE